MGGKSGGEQGGGGGDWLGDIAMKGIDFSESDLKEIFAVFCSCTMHELRQNYDKDDRLYYEKENLLEEYELHEERREYALDAVRGVLNWLQRHGYSLTKDGQVDDLSWVQDSLFIK